MAWTRRFAAVGVLVALGWLGSSHLTNARFSAQIDQLEREKTELVEYARRLGSSRRIAQINVLDQCLNSEKNTISELRWQEISPDGLLGSPILLQTIGGQDGSAALIYVEALIIKFEQRLVGSGDPERGASLALFRRVFGDHQTPDSAPLFDRATPPIVSMEGTSVAERSIWSRFWELIDDPRLAEALGVRIAQIEAPAVPIRAGQVWEVTLDAAGGLNLRKLAESPQRDLHWCPVAIGQSPQNAPGR